MSSQSKRGRPTRPFKTSWGEEVHGLYKCPDGRYRINATGQKFTQHDERIAVKQFREWQEANGQAVVPRVSLRFDPSEAPAPLTNDVSRGLQKVVDMASTGNLAFDTTEGQARAIFTAEIPDEIFWNSVRDLLINQPEVVARKTGIPELANLRHMKLPRPSPKIKDLIAIYEKHSSARVEASKRAAVVLLQRMADFCEATTLDDLTTEKLMAYKESVQNDPALESGATKRSYLARSKTIILFGKKAGIDPEQIAAAEARMSVLWTKAKEPEDDPRPITRENFHRLLNGAVGKWENWRPWLLLGLNLALHLKDVCRLKWSHFNMEYGTYSTIRVKTEEHKIPQVGVLWPESLAELRRLKTSGEYVFVSRHGTRYHRTSRGNSFAEFKKSLGMPEIQFDHLRDGAYTTAIQTPGVDEKFVRVMVGHKSPGLQDKYVLRNPQIAKPASDAVYREYFGEIRVLGGEREGKFQGGL